MKYFMYELKVCNSQSLEMSQYYLKEITPFFSVPNESYPHFSNWHKKISSEIFTPSRSIIVALENNKIMGFSILKHTNDENKICTFYIDKMYRKNKIGTLLMKKSLDLLCYNALLSINEKLVDSFYPILNKFEFNNIAIKNNYYQFGHKEYFFKR